jgi:gamma-glutamyltranspeptidase / glutathione hydrolase
MVVSAHVDASEAGVEILQQGGNAIDAAVATGFALAVVYPVAGNVGGGGFMVIRLANGMSTSIDYRETAPSGATRDMFLDEGGEFVPRLSQRGHLASGVPGAVAGMLLAHERYGVLPLAEVMAPAIRLAEEGFTLSDRQASQFNNFRQAFSIYDGTRRYFTRDDGQEWFQGGDVFVQRDLAEVLKRIRDQGRDGFYRGETADLIVAEMRRGGGLITHEDLQAYEAIEREPVVGFYKGHRVISMGPPSSGGVALMQLLNAATMTDIRRSGFNGSETIHFMAESMRRAYADRAEWLGDPDFFDVPVEGLTHPDYMRLRMADFSLDTVSISAETSHGMPLAYESTETTHYSIVDAFGNAVSTTTTINGAYGSHVVVDGAGFFLNNEMDDFSAAPGVPNMFGLVGSVANAIEPGKRMLSSMTPTILEDPYGRLFMVIGTPGGSTIITTVFQIIMNVVEHGMNIQEAVAVPRVHHQWLPDVLEYERGGLAADVVTNLQARGWEVRERSGTSGRADGIVVRYDVVETDVDPSGLDEFEAQLLGRILQGGADPRGENRAVGY